jgi:hypothetical protein
MGFLSHFKFIFRGLILSVKLFWGNTANYVSVTLATIFFFHSAALLSLVAAPGEAVAEIAAGDSLASSGLSNEFRAIPGEWELWSNDNDTAILLSQSEYPIADEHPIGGGEKPEETQKAVEPITRALPIWGEKVRSMGYDLPLPFGAGVNLVYMDQGIDIRNLKIGFGNANQEINRVSFSNARAKDKAATARLDLWLLPFANIYGILGHIDGETELDVNLPGITVNVPGIGQVPILDPATLNFDIDYDGTTYGGGLTLAGGYKNFFGSLDANYTYSDINLVDGDIKTLTISPRLGVLVDPAIIKGSFAFWIGAMYMDYKQTVTDSVNLNQLDPSLPSVELEFEIDIKNEEHWNFLMGGQWEITKRWQITAEGGVGNRRQIVIGSSFRF